MNPAHPIQFSNPILKAANDKGERSANDRRRAIDCYKRINY
jgi:hypothetical protein